MKGTTQQRRKGQTEKTTKNEHNSLLGTQKEADNRERERERAKSF